ncbi:MBL fold metallo-hydrolase [Patescibacteria group bacterium]
MKLTLLGTGEFRPHTQTASAGYTLQHGNTTLQLDFGRSVLSNMARAGIDWTTLDAILLSHLHPDHMGDLFHYLQSFAVCNHLKEIDTEITIYGPRDFQAYFQHLRRVIIAPWGKIPEIKELYDEKFTIGDFTIKAAPMKHPVDALGFRIEAGNKTICYTGDTAINDNLLELAQDADVLLAECSGVDDQPHEEHLAPADIAKVATEANVKKIVLTHYPPEEEVREKRRAAVQAKYAGEVVAGEDLMVIEI